jgi:hypothetical protein
LLGLAALGQLLASSLERLSPKLALAGLLVPAASGVGFARLAPISLADLATSAAAITAQQVALGRWAAAALPKDARLGVNDAGAIAFYSRRRTFDIVGLTTRGEARYWVAGAGSRFEHYQHLSNAELPTHFLVYPEWFGLPGLLGRCLTSRRVVGATILGGPEMVACEADFSNLRSGAKPSLALGARPLIDELDVADLESEAAHDYRLGTSSSAHNLVVTLGGNSDGGRSDRTHEDFRLRVAPSGLLLVRLSARAPDELTLSVAGKRALPATDTLAETQELSFAVPGGVSPGMQPVSLRSSTPVTVLHYWSYGPP